MSGRDYLRDLYKGGMTKPELAEILSENNPTFTIDKALKEIDRIVAGVHVPNLDPNMIREVQMRAPREHTNEFLAKYPVSLRQDLANYGYAQRSRIARQNLGLTTSTLKIHDKKTLENIYGNYNAWTNVSKRIEMAGAPYIAPQANRYHTQHLLRLSRLNNPSPRYATGGDVFSDILDPSMYSRGIYNLKNIEYFIGQASAAQTIANLSKRYGTTRDPLSSFTSIGRSLSRSSLQSFQNLNFIPQRALQKDSRNLFGIRYGHFSASLRDNGNIRFTVPKHFKSPFVNGNLRIPRYLQLSTRTGLFGRFAGRRFASGGDVDLAYQRKFGIDTYKELIKDIYGNKFQHSKQLRDYVKYGKTNLGMAQNIASIGMSETPFSKEILPNLPISNFELYTQKMSNEKFIGAYDPGMIRLNLTQIGKDNALALSTFSHELSHNAFRKVDTYSPLYESNELGNKFRNKYYDILMEKDPFVHNLSLNRIAKNAMNSYPFHPAGGALSNILDETLASSMGTLIPGEKFGNIIASDPKGYMYTGGSERVSSLYKRLLTKFPQFAIKRATGGRINGPGTSRSDSIPTFLPPGFVIPETTVGAMGTSFFDRILGGQQTFSSPGSGQRALVSNGEYFIPQSSMKGQYNSRFFNTLLGLTEDGNLSSPEYNRLFGGGVIRAANGADYTFGDTTGLPPGSKGGDTIVVKTSQGGTASTTVKEVKVDKIDAKNLSLTGTFKSGLGAVPPMSTGGGGGFKNWFFREAKSKQGYAYTETGELVPPGHPEHPDTKEARAVPRHRGDKAKNIWGTVGWTAASLSMSSMGVYFSILGLVTTLNKAITTLTSSVTDLNKTFEAQGMLRAFGSSIGLTGEQINKVVGSSSKLVDTWKKVTAMQSYVQVMFANLASKLFDNDVLMEKITGALTKLFDTLSQEDVVESFARLIGNIADALPSLIPAFETFVSVLSKISENKAAMQLASFALVMSMLMQPVMSLISAFGAILSSLYMIGGGLKLVTAETVMASSGFYKLSTGANTAALSLTGTQKAVYGLGLALRGLVPIFLAIDVGMTALNRMGYSPMEGPLSGMVATALGMPAPQTQGFSIGGEVNGPGDENDDRVPALLSDGEYVINAKSARKLGRKTLDKLNKLAAGGSANPASIPSGAYTGITPLSSLYQADAAKEQELTRQNNLTAQQNVKVNQATSESVTGAYDSGAFHVIVDNQLMQQTTGTGLQLNLGDIDLSDFFRLPPDLQFKVPELPKLEVEKIEPIKVEVEKIEPIKVEIDKTVLPKIEIDKIDLPKIEVDWSKIDWSKITEGLPKLKVEEPKIKIEEPKFEWPKLPEWKWPELPKLDLSGLKLAFDKFTVDLKSAIDTIKVELVSKVETVTKTVTDALKSETEAVKQETTKTETPKTDLWKSITDFFRGGTGGGSYQTTLEGTKLLGEPSKLQKAIGTITGGRGNIFAGQKWDLVGAGTIMDLFDITNIAGDIANTMYEGGDVFEAAKASILNEVLGNIVIQGGMAGLEKYSLANPSTIKGTLAGKTVGGYSTLGRGLLYGSPLIGYAETGLTAAQLEEMVKGQGLTAGKLDYKKTLPLMGTGMVTGGIPALLTEIGMEKWSKEEFGGNAAGLLGYKNVAEASISFLPEAISEALTNLAFGGTSFVKGVQAVPEAITSGDYNDEILSALTDTVSSSVATFFDTLNVGSTSLVGLPDIGEELGSTISNLIPTMDELNTSAKQISEGDYAGAFSTLVVNPMKESAGNLANGLVNYGTSIYDSANSAITGFMNLIVPSADAADSMEGVATASDTLGGALQPIGGSITSFNDNIVNGSKKVETSLSDTSSSISNYGDAVAQSLLALSETTDGFTYTWLSHTNNLVDSIDKVANTLSSTYGNIIAGPNGAYTVDENGNIQYVNNDVSSTYDAIEAKKQAEQDAINKQFVGTERTSDSMSYWQGALSPILTYLEQYSLGGTRSFQEALTAAFAEVDSISTEDTMADFAKYLTGTGGKTYENWLGSADLGENQSMLNSLLSQYPNTALLAAQATNTTTDALQMVNPNTTTTPYSVESEYDPTKDYGTSKWGLMNIDPSDSLEKLTKLTDIDTGGINEMPDGIMKVYDELGNLTDYGQDVMNGLDSLPTSSLLSDTNSILSNIESADLSSSADTNTTLSHIADSVSNIANTTNANNYIQPAINLYITVEGNMDSEVSDRMVSQIADRIGIVAQRW